MDTKAALEELGLDINDYVDSSNNNIEPPAPPESSSENLYLHLKRLQRDLQVLEAREEYLKKDQVALTKELYHSKEELKRIQAVPLTIGQFMEMVDEDYAIATSTTGATCYVRVSPTIDRQLLKTNASVAMHRMSNSIVMVLPPEADSTITLMQVTEKPDVTYADIGGMDIQKQEIREAVELPLTHGYLYQRIGIDPPRGVLMYGPPGTGKTMMAKAVAHHSSAAFIRVVGSEFVQKYLGEGPRMVRDVFRLAREQQPCIVFIDEVDSIATKRFDASTGADREVQRILLEILTQLDGFDQRTNVSVMMATNRADTLDPALLRPGRLDRKVEFPVPDVRQRRLIVGVCLQKMSLANDVTVDAVVELCNNYSAADITSLCQQAGLLALRANTHVVKIANFEAAARSIKQSQPTQMQFYQ